ncbi:mucin-5AC-like [Grus japonensis]|uniref:Mucin-5AC-like n=1 Tax=Grus japonensis TaxID=30415 RepID=A0ABC9XTL5_GRUJA
MMATSGRTQTSMATAGMTGRAWLGTIATVRGFTDYLDHYSAHNFPNSHHSYTHLYSASNIPCDQYRHVNSSGNHCGQLHLKGNLQHCCPVHDSSPHYTCTLFHSSTNISSSHTHHTPLHHTTNIRDSNYKDHGSPFQISWNINSCSAHHHGFGDNSLNHHGPSRNILLCSWHKHTCCHNLDSHSDHYSAHNFPNSHHSYTHLYSANNIPCDQYRHVNSSGNHCGILHLKGNLQHCCPVHDSSPHYTCTLFHSSTNISSSHTHHTPLHHTTNIRDSNYNDHGSPFQISWNINSCSAHHHGFGDNSLNHHGPSRNILLCSWHKHTCCHNLDSHSDHYSAHNFPNSHHSYTHLYSASNIPCDQYRHVNSSGNHCGILHLKGNLQHCCPVHDSSPHYTCTLFHSSTNISSSHTHHTPLHHTTNIRDSNYNDHGSPFQISWNINSCSAHHHGFGDNSLNHHGPSRNILLCSWHKHTCCHNLDSHSDHYSAHNFPNSHHSYTHLYSASNIPCDQNILLCSRHKHTCCHNLDSHSDHYSAHNFPNSHHSYTHLYSASNIPCDQYRHVNPSGNHCGQLHLKGNLQHCCPVHDSSPHYTCTLFHSSTNISSSHTHHTPLHHTTNIRDSNYKDHRIPFQISWNINSCSAHHHGFGDNSLNHHGPSRNILLCSWHKHTCCHNLDSHSDHYSAHNFPNSHHSYTHLYSASNIPCDQNILLCSWHKHTCCHNLDSHSDHYSAHNFPNSHHSYTHLYSASNIPCDQYRHVNSSGNHCGQLHLKGNLQHCCPVHDSSPHYTCTLFHSSTNISSSHTHHTPLHHTTNIRDSNYKDHRIPFQISWNINSCSAHHHGFGDNSLNHHGPSRNILLCSWHKHTCCHNLDSHSDHYSAHNFPNSHHSYTHLYSASNIPCDQNILLCSRHKHTCCHNLDSHSDHYSAHNFPNSHHSYTHLYSASNIPCDQYRHVNPSGNHCGQLHLKGNLQHCCPVHDSSPHYTCTLFHSSTNISSSHTHHTPLHHTTNIRDSNYKDHRIPFQISWNINSCSAHHHGFGDNSLNHHGPSRNILLCSWHKHTCCHNLDSHSDHYSAHNFPNSHHSYTHLYSASNIPCDQNILLCSWHKHTCCHNLDSHSDHYSAHNFPNSHHSYTHLYSASNIPCDQYRHVNPSGNHCGQLHHKGNLQHCCPVHDSSPHYTCTLFHSSTNISSSHTHHTPLHHTTNIRDSNYNDHGSPFQISWNINSCSAHHHSFGDNSLNHHGPSRNILLCSWHKHTCCHNLDSHSDHYSAHNFPNSHHSYTHLYSASNIPCDQNILLCSWHKHTCCHNLDSHSDHYSAHNFPNSHHSYTHLYSASNIPCDQYRHVNSSGNHCGQLHHKGNLQHCCPVHDSSPHYTCTLFHSSTNISSSHTHHTPLHHTTNIRDSNYNDHGSPFQISWNINSCSAHHHSFGDNSLNHHGPSRNILLCSWHKHTCCHNLDSHSDHYSAHNFPNSHHSYTHLYSASNIPCDQYRHVNSSGNHCGQLHLKGNLQHCCPVHDSSPHYTCTLFHSSTNISSSHTHHTPLHHTTNIRDSNYNDHGSPFQISWNINSCSAHHHSFGDNSLNHHGPSRNILLCSWHKHTCCHNLDSHSDHYSAHNFPNSHHSYTHLYSASNIPCDHYTHLYSASNIPCNQYRHINSSGNHCGQLHHKGNLQHCCPVHDSSPHYTCTLFHSSTNISSSHTHHTPLHHTTNIRDSNYNDHGSPFQISWNINSCSAHHHSFGDNSLNHHGPSRNILLCSWHKHTCCHNLDSHSDHYSAHNFPNSHHSYTHLYSASNIPCDQYRHVNSSGNHCGQLHLKGNLQHCCPVHNSSPHYTCTLFHSSTNISSSHTHHTPLHHTTNIRDSNYNDHGSPFQISWNINSCSAHHHSFGDNSLNHHGPSRNILLCSWHKHTCCHNLDSHSDHYSAHNFPNSHHSYTHLYSASNIPCDQYRHVNSSGNHCGQLHHKGNLQHCCPVHNSSPHYTCTLFHSSTNISSSHTHHTPLHHTTNIRDSNYNDHGSPFQISWNINSCSAHHHSFGDNSLNHHGPSRNILLCSWHKHTCCHNLDSHSDHYSAHNFPNSHHSYTHLYSASNIPCDQYRHVNPSGNHCGQLHLKGNLQHCCPVHNSSPHYTCTLFHSSTNISSSHTHHTPLHHTTNIRDSNYNDHGSPFQISWNINSCSAHHHSFGDNSLNHHGPSRNILLCSWHKHTCCHNLDSHSDHYSAHNFPNSHHSYTHLYSASNIPCDHYTHLYSASNIPCDQYRHVNSSGNHCGQLHHKGNLQHCCPVHDSSPHYTCTLFHSSTNISSSHTHHTPLHHTTNIRDSNYNDHGSPFQISWNINSCSAHHHSFGDNSLNHHGPSRNILLCSWHKHTCCHNLDSHSDHYSAHNFPNSHHSYTHLYSASNIPCDHYTHLYSANNIPCDQYRHVNSSGNHCGQLHHKGNLQHCCPVHNSSPHYTCTLFHSSTNISSSHTHHTPLHHTRNIRDSNYNDHGSPFQISWNINSCSAHHHSFGDNSLNHHGPSRNILLCSWHKHTCCHNLDSHSDHYSEHNFPNSHHSYTHLYSASNIPCDQYRHVNSSGNHCGQLHLKGNLQHCCPVHNSSPHYTCTLFHSSTNISSSHTHHTPLHHTTNIRDSNYNDHGSPFQISWNINSCSAHHHSFGDNSLNHHGPSRNILLCSWHKHTCCHNLDSHSDHYSAHNFPNSHHSYTHLYSASNIPCDQYRHVNSSGNHCGQLHHKGNLQHCCPVHNSSPHYTCTLFHSSTNISSSHTHHTPLHHTTNIRDSNYNDHGSPFQISWNINSCSAHHHSFGDNSLNHHGPSRNILLCSWHKHTCCHNLDSHSDHYSAHNFPNSHHSYTHLYSASNIPCDQYRHVNPSGNHCGQLHLKGNLQHCCPVHNSSPHYTCTLFHSSTNISSSHTHHTPLHHTTNIRDSNYNDHGSPFQISWNINSCSAHHHSFGDNSLNHHGPSRNILLCSWHKHTCCHNLDSHSDHYSAHNFPNSHHSYTHLYSASNIPCDHYTHLYSASNIPCDQYRHVNSSGNHCGQLHHKGNLQHCCPVHDSSPHYTCTLFHSSTNISSSHTHHTPLHHTTNIRDSNYNDHGSPFQISWNINSCSAHHHSFGDNSLNHHGPSRNILLCSWHKHTCCHNLDSHSDHYSEHNFPNSHHSYTHLYSASNIPCDHYTHLYSANNIPCDQYRHVNSSGNHCGQLHHKGNLQHCCPVHNSSPHYTCTLFHSSTNISSSHTHHTPLHHTTNIRDSNYNDHGSPFQISWNINSSSAHHHSFGDNSLNHHGPSRNILLCSWHKHTCCHNLDSHSDHYSAHNFPNSHHSYTHLYSASNIPCDQYRHVNSSGNHCGQLHHKGNLQHCCPVHDSSPHYTCTLFHSSTNISSSHTHHTPLHHTTNIRDSNYNDHGSPFQISWNINSCSAHHHSFGDNSLNHHGPSRNILLCSWHKHTCCHNLDSHSDHYSEHNFPNSHHSYTHLYSASNIPCDQYRHVNSSGNHCGQLHLKGNLQHCCPVHNSSPHYTCTLFHSSTNISSHTHHTPLHHTTNIRDSNYNDHGSPFQISWNINSSSAHHHSFGDNSLNHHGPSRNILLCSWHKHTCCHNLDSHSDHYSAHNFPNSHHSYTHLYSASNIPCDQYRHVNSSGNHCGQLHHKGNLQHCCPVHDSSPHYTCTLFHSSTNISSSHTHHTPLHHTTNIRDSNYNDHGSPFQISWNINSCSAHHHSFGDNSLNHHGPSRNILLCSWHKHTCCHNLDSHSDHYSEHNFPNSHHSYTHLYSASNIPCDHYTHLYSASNIPCDQYRHVNSSGNHCGQLHHKGNLQHCCPVHNSSPHYTCTLFHSSTNISSSHTHHTPLHHTTNIRDSNYNDHGSPFQISWNINSSSAHHHSFGDNSLNHHGPSRNILLCSWHKHTCCHNLDSHSDHYSAHNFPNSHHSYTHLYSASNIPCDQYRHVNSSGNHCGQLHHKGNLQHCCPVHDSSPHYTCTLFHSSTNISSSHTHHTPLHHTTNIRDSNYNDHGSPFQISWNINSCSAHHHGFRDNSLNHHGPSRNILLCSWHKHTCCHNLDSHSDHYSAHNFPNSHHSYTHLYSASNIPCDQNILLCSWHKHTCCHNLDSHSDHYSAHNFPNSHHSYTHLYSASNIPCDQYRHVNPSGNHCGQLHHKGNLQHCCPVHNSSPHYTCILFHSSTNISSHTHHTPLHHTTNIRDSNYNDHGSPFQISWNINSCSAHHHSFGDNSLNHHGPSRNILLCSWHKHTCCHNLDSHSDHYSAHNFPNSHHSYTHLYSASNIPCDQNILLCSWHKHTCCHNLDSHSDHYSAHNFPNSHHSYTHLYSASNIPCDQYRHVNPSGNHCGQLHLKGNLQHCCPVHNSSPHYTCILFHSSTNISSHTHHTPLHHTTNIRDSNYNDHGSPFQISWNINSCSAHHHSFGDNSLNHHGPSRNILLCSWHKHTCCHNLDSHSDHYSAHNFPNSHHSYTHLYSASNIPCDQYRHVNSSGNHCGQLHHKGNLQHCCPVHDSSPHYTCTLFHSSTNISSSHTHHTPLHHTTNIRDSN